MTLSRRKLLGFLAAAPVAGVSVRLPQEPPMIAVGDAITSDATLYYPGAITWVDPDDDFPPRFSFHEGRLFWASGDKTAPDLWSGG